MMMRSMAKKTLARGERWCGEDGSPDGGGDEFAHWLQALKTVVPSPDDGYENNIFYETSRGEEEEQEEQEAAEVEVAGHEPPSNALPSNINCYKKRNTSLPDLPLENDKNYLQENQQYFARKSNYVRADKFKMRKMLPPDGPSDDRMIDLPSIISVFGSSDNRKEIME